MAKYALITGGTKGIGKAVASCLAQAGYDLVLTYGSDTTGATAAAAEIRIRHGVKVDVLQADISDQQTIERIADYLSDCSLTLDAIVFNAGLTYRKTLEEMALSEWERIFFANVHFPVFLLQRILGQIRSGGSVVFTGSLTAIEPHAMSLAYGVTKAAVHALTHNLVKFLAPYNIRVNAVAPGFVDTEWQKNKPLEIRQSIESKIAMGRFCTPEEVAGIYKMLIENTYINGSIIVADGGYSYK